MYGKVRRDKKITITFPLARVYLVVLLEISYILWKDMRKASENSPSSVSVDSARRRALRYRSQSCGQT